MRQIMFVCAIALSMFACKKSGGAAGEAASKMEGFAKEMCECKDKGCGDKVNESMLKWSQEMAKSAGKDTDTKPDPDITKRMTDATTKLGDCYGKLATGGATTTDKPADPPKTDDKKPEDKTAEPAKADEKKPDDKAAEPAKADDKKADDKKPDDKKSGGW